MKLETGSGALFDQQYYFVYRNLELTKYQSWSVKQKQHRGRANIWLAEYQYCPESSSSVPTTDQTCSRVHMEPESPPRHLSLEPASANTLAGGGDGSVSGSITPSRRNRTEERDQEISSEELQAGMANILVENLQKFQEQINLQNNVRDATIAKHLLDMTGTRELQMSQSQQYQRDIAENMVLLGRRQVSHEDETKRLMECMHQKQIANQRLAESIKHLADERFNAPLTQNIKTEPSERERRPLPPPCAE